MKILNQELSRLVYGDFFAQITKLEKQTIVFTPNPEILLQAASDPEFSSLLKKADYLTPDGIGLYLAAQVLEEKNKFLSILKLPYYIYRIVSEKWALFEKYGDKICGSDLTNDLLAYAEQEKVAITIIDPYFPKDKAKCESQKYFRENLSKIFPELQFDFYIYKPDEKDDIIKKIANSKTKMLFSTLGMKKQEQSVVEIMGKCSNIKLGLGIGSSFDYLTGFQKRAPKFIIEAEFEWLYRIFF